MAMLYNLILQLCLPITFIVLALFTGRAAERSHFRSIVRREQEMADMVVSDIKTFPGGAKDGPRATLVAGQVVIATDYLKTWLANIRKFFGGELKSYESLMDRARREAVLRMLEEARGQGFDAVCNLRLGFADIGGVSGMKRAAMVEVFAYGTAYCTNQG